MLDAGLYSDVLRFEANRPPQWRSDLAPSLHLPNFGVLSAWRAGQSELLSVAGKRRGSQVVRQGSAKALCVGSIPTLASKAQVI